MKMASRQPGEPLYLDYAATTPVDPEVAATMGALLMESGDFANPSSGHVLGRRASRHVETAAARLGSLLGAAPERLVWTSGATESDNLAIIGAARARAHRGRHLVTMRTEHKAVTDPFSFLEQEGFEVRRSSGSTTATLSRALRPRSTGYSKRLRSTKETSIS